MALTHLNSLIASNEAPDAGSLGALQSAMSSLSPWQIAWVGGYLRGLCDQTAPATEGPAQTPASTLSISLLYGAQSGSAGALAESLAVRARAQGLQVRVRSMANFGPRRLIKEALVLFILGTQDEGEPPESAQPLHALLHDPRAPRLDGLRYAVLGLDAASGTHGCRTAADFDRRLAELGARRILPLQCGGSDQATDTERWSADVLERLAQLTLATPGGVAAAPVAHPGQPARAGKSARNAAGVSGAWS